MARGGKKMSKAELQERVIQERAIRDALAWPEAEVSVPLSEDECMALVKAAPDGRARAWTYNVGRGEVDLGAFDSFNHNPTGPFKPSLFCSKGLGGPWYTSREDACHALRIATTREVARRLLTLDQRIATFLAAGLPEGAPETNRKSEAVRATGPSRPRDTSSSPCAKVARGPAPTGSTASA